MPGKIFLAGASGVIGTRLIPLLVRDGWLVVGSTRSRERFDLLRRLGAEPVQVDAFNRSELTRAVANCQPDVVVHQLTDLPSGLDPDLLPAALLRNARLRMEGTRNLVHAAIAAKARRFVAQSISFAYAACPHPIAEGAPLDIAAPGTTGLTAQAVHELEQQVLASPLEGIVLRYGRLYGAGTGFAQANRSMSLHANVAAEAARRACILNISGVFNIAEEDGLLDVTKAKNAFGDDLFTKWEER